MSDEFTRSPEPWPEGPWQVPDEIRRSPVDGGRRLAELQLRVRQWREGWPSIGDNAPDDTLTFLLDHIDSLTAKLEVAIIGRVHAVSRLADVEAERDALRQSRADWREMAERFEAERDALRAAVEGILSNLQSGFVTDALAIADDCVRLGPESSPPPVEGGQ